MYRTTQHLSHLLGKRKDIDYELARVMITVVIPKLKLLLEEAAAEMTSEETHLQPDVFALYIAQQMILNKLAIYITMTDIDLDNTLPIAMLEEQYTREWFDCWGHTLKPRRSSIDSARDNSNEGLTIP